ncbi:MAG: DegV family protein [Chloroflexi bacterium]|nr:DegV family protein [Chloroflexota bacterium]
MTLRIVTDSTADLPPALAAQHAIGVVPLTVLFGDEQLRDGVDITSEKFFRRLVREQKLPTTSQPAPGDFRAAYETLIAEGASEILSIHISGKLSRTIESARMGAEGLPARIEHLDSGLASLALGLGVMTAAMRAAAGASLDETRALVADQFARTHLYFMVDTLEFLRRGGRIGRAQELIGSLLQFKPLLAIEAGVVEPIGRARTKQRALEELLRLAGELRPIEQMMAVHATTPDDLKFLVDRLYGLAPDAPITVGRITPVIGVHGGPGLLGFAVVTASRSAR